MELMVANPDFTIADVLAWARTKPADEKYDYVDNRQCALAQFLRETEIAKDPYVIPCGYWLNGRRGRNRQFGYALNTALHADTFGELTERLEQVVA
jgi:hypothetical protein